MSSVQCDDTGCRIEQRPGAEKTAQTNVSGGPGVTPEGKTVQVDVISDNVCPWCFVGKRRLEAAMKKLDSSKVKVQINWLPFQLDPHAPTKSVDKKQHYLKKFGPRAEMMIERLRQEGLKDGIKFHPLEGATVGNTLVSHRLIEWSKQFGLDLQNKLVEVLFHDYFELGGDLTDKEHLADIAQQAGLDRTKARAFLDSDDLTDKVKHEIEEAYGANIGGVPHFKFSNGLELNGAQPVETFLHAFKKLGVYDGPISHSSSL